MITHAIFVLGDQLSERCGAFEGMTPKNTIICMSERLSEGSRPLSHVARIAYFLCAMRRFSQKMKNSGWNVAYRNLTDVGEPELWRDLASMAKKAGATNVRCAWPGEYGLVQKIEDACLEFNLILEWVEDKKFIFSPAQFTQWAKSRTSMLQEAFYRHARLNKNVLLENGVKPKGGQWNFDAANRKGYSKAGPPKTVPRPVFELTGSDREVLSDVQTTFPNHPGSIDHFNWPLDEVQALQAVDYFLEHHLAEFGTYQDAMWTTEPFGNHALLSAPLNVGLIDPLELCRKVEARFDQGLCSIESAEGFIRQVLGWREYIHGMYWLRMPKLESMNEMKGTLNLPAWFWDPTKTKMACMSASIGQTFSHGYAHHIQRLMIIGNFCLSAGIEPKQVADWFGGIYVDAVEWVHLPNVLGMSLHADGGDLATKPYFSGGSYISKQSNYCKNCAYDPKEKTGDSACPMSVMYWGAVERHKVRLAANPRTSMPVALWHKLPEQTRKDVLAKDAYIRNNLDQL